MWLVIYGERIAAKLVHGIGAKLVSNWEQDVIYQKLANFMYKKNTYVNRLTF